MSRRAALAPAPLRAVPRQRRRQRGFTPTCRLLAFTSRGGSWRSARAHWRDRPRRGEWNRSAVSRLIDGLDGGPRPRRTRPPTNEHTRCASRGRPQAGHDRSAVERRCVHRRVAAWSEEELADFARLLTKLERALSGSWQSRPSPSLWLMEVRRSYAPLGLVSRGPSSGGRLPAGDGLYRCQRPSINAWKTRSTTTGGRPG